MRKLINWIRSWFVRPIPPSSPIEEEPPLPPPPKPTVKDRLLELHNLERSKRSVPALNMNFQLETAAQSHSQWMADNNRLTHNQPGISLSGRIERAGYSEWSFIGENIAYGQSMPEIVMNDWMDSSGHKNNIISKNYKEVGFGMVQKGNVMWWTAIFGAK